MLASEAFYTFAKDRGPGGLPTGVSGKVACLLSGGIDSPVAAWRMMKRGCSALLVHFHSYPFLSRASQEKVRELAQLLTTYQQRTRLFLVAFGEIQRQVVLTVPAPLRVVIYRRLMMRIADRIASDARRARAGHRRGDRPGRLADAREHVGHRGGDEPADPEAARRDGQGGDRGRGRAPRHLRRSRSCPTRTAASCSRRSTPPPARRAPRSRRPRAGCRSRRWWRRLWPRRGIEQFSASRRLRETGVQPGSG